MTVKSAGTDESHIRPGEVQVPLPAADRRLALFHRPHPHALDRRGRTARRTPGPPGNPGWSAPSRSIRAGQQALPGVETCSHLIVLYWMDRARRDLAVQMPTRAEAGRPTFSLRSPVRPNPIALSRGRASQGRGQHASQVVGLDCLDGTPLLDIKPYFATTDSIPDARAVSHGGR